MKTQTKLNWLAAAILWSATLDGLSQPRIVTQPIDQWVDLADSVTCFVVVGIVGGTWGTGPTYQWRFNSEDMPGATQRQLVLTNFQANQVGEYSVVASHATGNATSRVARLELNIVRPRVFGNIRALPDGSVSILLDGNPSGRLRKFFDLSYRGFERSAGMDAVGNASAHRYLRSSHLSRRGKPENGAAFIEHPRIISVTPFRLRPGLFGFHRSGCSPILRVPTATDPHQQFVHDHSLYPARLRADQPASLVDPPLAGRSHVEEHGFTSLERSCPIWWAMRGGMSNWRGRPSSVVVSPGFTDVRGDRRQNGVAGQLRTIGVAY